jgi:hypothetical protein
LVASVREPLICEIKFPILTPAFLRLAVWGLDLVAIAFRSFSVLMRFASVKLPLTYSHP